MDRALARLRPFNLVAAALHLASLVGILLLSNSASLPVTATYLNGPPGTDAFTDPINLFSLNISAMVIAFLALSAFFHLLVASPMFFGRYTAGLQQHRNTFRWVEYSLSSSIMIVVILQLNGIADFGALLGLFAANVAMILFGWLQEKYVEPGSGDFLPFFFGCIAGAVPWIVVVINLFSPGGPDTATVPGFVYGIVISLFLFFNA
ncbi:heliorhodopsin HeR, partial [Demequina sp.]|uniref:heliorhodopsin HeR n=1 Tax=Demequina sp. TaxID=2050685 RepID=UPI0025F4095E